MKRKARAREEPPDNFRDYPVAPTQVDLEKSNDSVFLRANLVEGQYPSVDDYLDVQFRLMREDLVSPLRKGLQSLRNLDVELRREKSVSDIYVYREAVVKYPVCLQTGIAYVVRFDCTRHRNIWDSNKKLIFGSLLCFLSEDYTRALFAVIVDRSPKALRERSEIIVKFTEEVTAEELCEKFVMIESPAYFEAYRHVLARLQSFKADRFPFADNIVFCKGEVKAPEYLLQNGGYEFDFKCILSKEIRNVDKVLVDPLETKQWPAKEDFGLDNSQYEALKNAVTHRIALVQGPPGTGKTFLGLKITRLLLENVVKRQTKVGPILVVCYTNHALDQFVEGIATFPAVKIVRVGGRSKSESLRRFNLAEIRHEYIQNRKMDFFIRSSIGEIREEIGILDTELTNYSARLCATGEHVMHLQVLEQFICKNHIDDLVGETRKMSERQQKFEDWLLGLPTDDVTLLSQEKAPPEEGAREVGDEKEQTAEFEDEGAFQTKQRRLDDDERNMQDARKKVEEKLRELLGDDFVSLDREPTGCSNQETGWRKVRSRGNAQRRQCFRELSSNDCMTDEEEERIVSPLQLHPRQKWRLYRLWRQRYRRLLRDAMEDLMRRYDAACQEFEEYKAHSDRVIMSNHNVIAMTTTGAARYGQMLNILRPKILIVEEAAEVLESHVVASLSEGCEHLILIGDHKQLRPSPTVFELAKRYKLDVSMFERLIRNNFKYSTLGLQHRMRPEISRFLRQEKLYPDLKDHESVTHRPMVKGIACNLYFVEHQRRECEDVHIKSYSNVFEASYAARLCRHLLNQGYKPENITVLTLYTGQLFELKKHMPPCEGLRVTVVDNYQGEENEIIILSLVRSNSDKKIGFVGVDNRICVAISRARSGLFVIGNFSLFQQVSTLWDNILKMARADSQIGPGLPLCCQLHPTDSKSAADTKTATTAEEFDSLSPEGGCMQDCGERLKCGHVCIKKCHPTDREHEDYKCWKPCGKVCRRGTHTCKKPCFKDCTDCDVEMQVVREECGHAVNVSCFKADDNVSCSTPCNDLLDCGHVCQKMCGEPHTDRCSFLVKKKFKPCGHEREMQCFSIKDAKCEELCKHPLTCGHSCLNICCKSHATYCTALVTKKSPSCGHQVKAECSEKVVPEMCKAPCGQRLPCGHKCQNKCGEDHTKVCNVVVKKKLPYCDHEVEMACGSKSFLPCDVPCKKRFDCGHFCPNTCCKSHTKYCTEIVRKKLPACGHLVRMKCRENAEDVKCDRPCEDLLDCGHICQKKCGENHTENCSVVRKKTFPCGHVGKLECHNALSAKCNFSCEEYLDCGHLCQKICGRSHTKLCSVTVTKKLPECGHEIEVACGEDVKSIRCTEKCQHRLDCGHKCNNKCCKDHAKICTVSVRKKHPDCGHTVTVACGKDAKEALCGEPCSKTLDCGHKCQKKCGKSHTKLCTVVEIELRDCGHEEKKMCGVELQRVGCSKLHSPCEHLDGGHRYVGLCRTCKEKRRKKLGCASSLEGDLEIRIGEMIDEVFSLKLRYLTIISRLSCLPKLRLTAWKTKDEENLIFLKHTIELMKRLEFHCLNICKMKVRVTQMCFISDLRNFLSELLKAIFVRSTAEFEECKIKIDRFDVLTRIIKIMSQNPGQRILDASKEIWKKCISYQALDESVLTEELRKLEDLERRLKIRDTLFPRADSPLL